MAETPAARGNAVLEIRRHYPAAPENVWRAWTDPQALTRWFGPGEANSVFEAQLDVRVGGRYSIAFRTPDGEEHRVRGEYVEVDEPRKLVFSWAWQSTPDRVSRVAVELHARDGGCDLLFRQDRFFDEAARNGHERGWTATFRKLDELFTD